MAGEDDEYELKKLSSKDIICSNANNNSDIKEAELPVKSPIDSSANQKAPVGNPEDPTTQDLRNQQAQENTESAQN